MTKGPCSCVKPSIEEQPGPPLNHTISGYVLGLVWDSTNM